MTKRKVNILITLMAVAMIGIIVLQVVWLNNAMQVRNELFDRSVNEALSQTSKKLETMSDVFFVQDIMRPGIGMGKGMGRIMHQRTPMGFRFSPDVVRSRNDSVTMQFHYNLPANNATGNQIHVITSESGDSTNRDVLVEVVQMDSVINQWEERIEHNITIMLDNSLKNIDGDSAVMIEKRDMVRRFGNRADRLKNVAGKMIYESWVMDMEHTPDTVTIRQVLSEELQNRAVPIPFEIGVFNSKDKLFKSDQADSIQLVNTQYTTDLNPGEIFDRGEKLAVYFPSRQSFILKTLIGPASLSLLFCAFIMAVFGLSIFYILNQKKISEMKSDFINNMTHEFKTPLATISVATDTIVNPKVIGDGERVRHFADVIKKENQRMNQQVESILQIARLDKKDFELNFKVVNIHEIIEKSVQINSFQVENRGGNIELELNALNPAVTTDPVQVLSVLNNLLDNANKYSTNAPEIKVKTRNSDRGVWIAVTDRGIGMSKQVQQKIFEKFYRETSGNIHNVKGFGLGLSYSKAIIDANKGEIRVKSEVGKGSTFEVFIPFAIQGKE